MNKPIHTPGPLYVSIVEHETPVLQSAALEEDNFICEVEGRDKGEAKVNARLLAAAYNAFNSAATKLGVNAVELAETMASGGLAEIIEAVKAAKEMSDWFMEHSRQADHAHEELKQPLEETAGWKELVDAGYNGLMASYHGQFEEALAKVKGGAS